MELRQKNYDEETVYKFYTQFRFSNIVYGNLCETTANKNRKNDII